MNKRHVVHTATEVRREIAHPFATLTVLLPAPGTLHASSGFALEQFDFLARVERLAVAFDEIGLVVEQVALTGGAGHEQLHDAFGLGLVMEAAVELGPR